MHKSAIYDFRECDTDGFFVVDQHRHCIEYSGNGHARQDVLKGMNDDA